MIEVYPRSTMIRAKHSFKIGKLSNSNDQCHVAYVKGNWCEQLALDGVAGIRIWIIYKLNYVWIHVLKTLLSSVFFLLLLTTLSYKTPFTYSVEKRFQSDFGVSIPVSTLMQGGW